MNSTWSRPFFLGEWQKLKAKHTITHLGGASSSLWSLQGLFNLAGEEKAFELLEKKMSYSSLQGSLSLRTNISQLYETVNAENVVLFCGAQEALSCLYLSLLNKNDAVVSLSPSYAPMTLSLQKIGANCIEQKLTMSENKWSLNFDELKDKVIANKASLVVTNFPHNPTGFIPEHSIWKQFLESMKVPVICDEVFRGLEFGAISPAICDVYDKGISVGSMSKTFACPSLRIGWVVCKDQALIQKLLNVKRYFSICCSLYDEFIANLVLEHKDELLHKHKMHIRNNLNYIHDSVVPQIKDEWLQFNDIDAGLLLFPKLNLSVDATTFCSQFLEASGVRFEPGECFASDIKNHFRVGLGSHNLSAGFERLFEFIKKIER